VRGGRRGRQVRAKVELRPKEDDPEEQRQNADAVRLGLHVLTKTKLRQEWLRGQEDHFLPGVSVCNQSGLSDVKSAKVKCKYMDLHGAIFGRNVGRRALALLACAALLYFAAGGSLFHEHTNGPDTACHICQALHMPALAAARLDLISAPQIVTWYSSLPQHAAPSDSFSLHRAGRAPPTA
jgi:hypothetical protein